jgi:hypothetical protein
MGIPMTHLLRFESRVSLRVQAAAMTVALHLGLVFLLLSANGRFDGLHDGETSITRLVLFESPQAERRDGREVLQRQPVDPELSQPDRLDANETEPPPPIREPWAETEAPTEVPIDSTNVVPLELTASLHVDPVEVLEQPNVFVSPQTEKSALVRDLTRLAEKLTKTRQAQMTWEQEGKQYHAALVMQPASNGVEFDHVIAEVSAEDHGRTFRTQIRLKRLAFSHYTQMIDRWDPMVQLHDDEIVGRFHVNSQFNLLYDGRKTPVFLGKVTTAANSFSTQATGRRREAEIFRGGIETRAGLIALPEEVRPFEWAPREENIRVHEFTDDTHIRFFADGSYSWQGRNRSTKEYRNEPSERPVYFIASSVADLHVQGVVRGKVLVYSPQRIVVEGNLTYARDPRDDPDSGDYLGLVSDRFIEVAPNFVTGPGDLEIHAALFAGRRFLVRDIDYPRTATLRILGSLAAGSISATEPRYATRIEYDSRFEQQRPPGFPSTDRFSADDWDGRWVEASERTADR